MLSHFINTHSLPEYQPTYLIITIRLSLIGIRVTTTFTPFFPSPSGESYSLRPHFYAPGARHVALLANPPGLPHSLQRRITRHRHERAIHELSLQRHHRRLELPDYLVWRQYRPYKSPPPQFSPFFPPSMAFTQLASLFSLPNTFTLTRW